MSPVSPNAVSPIAALLSATTMNESGDTVVAHQIAALRSNGIVKFLIEVDSVPGALLAIADRITNTGCSVDFIRSAHDLQSKMGSSERLIVQAEGIYLAPNLLTEILGQNREIIVTIDGRDENDAFERMDLNTRWTGFAVLPASIPANIGGLPDGWSLTSSLLRQAMQNGLMQQPLNQNNVQSGHLRRIVTALDAKKLASDILVRRAGTEAGFIEARIFGPIAAKLAPALSRVNPSAALSIGSVLVPGALSVGLAASGWFGAASGAALAAIFANSVRSTVIDLDYDRRWGRWIEPLLWLLLATALLLACNNNASLASEGLFAAVVVAGLALLARQLQLPDWAKKILQSPALIALSLLMLLPIVGINMSAKLVGVIQLALLVAAKWKHK